MKDAIVWLVLPLSLGILSGCNKDGNLSSPIGSNWVKGQGIQGYGISGLGAIGQNFVAGSSCAPCSQAYVFLSSDGGLTWNLQESFHVNNHAPNNRLYIYPQETFFAHGAELYLGIQSGGNGSIYASTDGGVTWTQKDTSFTKEANCFAAINDTIFVGTNHGVFYSIDNGASWDQADTAGMSQPVDELAVIGSILFAATPGEGIYRTTNGAQGWTPINATTFDFHGLASIGNALFASAFGDSSLGGVFVSTDLGGNWERADDGLRDKGVNALCATAAELFVGTNSGVFASSDEGTTWKDISIGVSLPSVSTLSVVGQYLLVGTSDGVWRYRTPNG